MFRCSKVQELREMMVQSINLKEFIERTAQCKNDEERLRLFLGGDMAEEDELIRRSTFLSILKDKHSESLGTV